LARWLSDGNIEFLGRTDHQVKIRGYRIELAEIENRLLSCDSVKNTAVMVKQNTPNDKFICAYIVPEKEFNTERLRKYLFKTLPDYMVPSFFVKLDKIPLTSNGKIDRRALPEPEFKSDNKYIPPRNDIEKRLVDIWQQVLRVNKETLGIDSSFFELGGHSLKATVLVSKIYKVFNVKISLVEFFKNPFIKKLADFINRSVQDKFTAIPITEKREYYPLSPSQMRVYIAHQVNPESKSYNMSGIFSLAGEPDRQKLEKVFQALIQRHESLRTSFAMVAKKPVQVVHDRVEFRSGYYNACQKTGKTLENNGMKQMSLLEPNGSLDTFLPEDYSSHVRLEYLERLINYFIQPFDLSVTPLMRVGMIKENEGKHIMVIDMHHITSDGVSMDILVNDFLDLYEDNQMQPLAVQYKDFSQWQNRQLDSGDLRKQEAYWFNRFKGEIPLLELPTDYPRPPQQSFAGDTISAEIGESLTGQLKVVMAQHEVTFYMISLAIYTLLLFQYTGQNDIIVGMPIAGRRHADLDKVVGMFINVLLIRNIIDENARFEEFIEEVKKNVLQAFDNQDYPFDSLVAQLDIKRDASRNPLYEVVFAQEFQVEQEFRIPGLELKTLDNEKRPLKTDLRLGIKEIDNRIKLLLTYSTALFKKETAENMLQHYREILEQVVKNKRLKLGNINISHDYEALDVNADWCEELEFNF
jgi:acyl carrier protein